MSGGQRFGDFESDVEEAAKIASDLGARTTPPFGPAGECALCLRRLGHLYADPKVHAPSCEWARARLRHRRHATTP